MHSKYLSLRQRLIFFLPTPKTLLPLLFLLMGTCLSAQVGINTDQSNPDPSAMLDVQSTAKGMLIPRMDNSQRTGIQNPALGLMVFDTSSESFWYFSSNGWIELVNSSANLGDNLGNHTATTNLNMAGFETNDAYRIFFNDSQGGKIWWNNTANSNISQYVTAITNSIDSYGFLSGTTNTFVHFGVPANGNNEGSGWIWKRALQNANEGLMSLNSEGKLTLLGDAWFQSSIGIGTNMPDEELHVVGNIKMEDGNQQSGYVLTSDANGVASWAAAPSGADNLGNHTATTNLNMAGFEMNDAYRIFFNESQGGKIWWNNSTDPTVSQYLSAITENFENFGFHNGTSNTFVHLSVPANGNVAGSGWIWKQALQNPNEGLMSLNSEGKLTLLGDAWFQSSIGIGTDTPDEELHVVGNIKMEDGNQQSGYVLTSDANGVASWAAAPSGADNLGNHTATTALTMNNNEINILSRIFFTNTEVGKIWWNNTPSSSVTQYFSMIADGTDSFGYLTGSSNTFINSNVPANGDNTGTGWIWKRALQNPNEGLMSLTSDGNLTLLGDAWFQSSIGIGTDMPDEELHVVGNIKMVDGNQQNGYVLTSNANGVASWAPAPSGADNLGNHTATTDLDMNERNVNETKQLKFALNNNTDKIFYHPEVIGSLPALGAFYRTGLSENKSFGFVNDTEVSLVQTLRLSGTSANDGQGWIWRNTTQANDEGLMSLTSQGRWTLLGDAWFKANVGIGTDMPSEALDVVGNVDISGDLSVDEINSSSILSIPNAVDIDGILNADGGIKNSSALNGEGLRLLDVNNNTRIRIFPTGQVTVGNAGSSNSAGAFLVNSDATNATNVESYRVNIWNLANPTTNNLRANGMLIRAGRDNNNGQNSRFMSFERPNGTVIGRIVQTGNNALAYNNVSDARMKANIVPTQKGLAELMNIEIYDYNYIDDRPDEIRTGFLAQQLIEHFPQAVEKGGADPRKAPWMIELGQVTPLLVKAVQEQQATIEGLTQTNKKLQAENAVLNSRLDQLEAQMQAIQAALEKQ